MVLSEEDFLSNFADAEMRNLMIEHDVMYRSCYPSDDTRFRQSMKYSLAIFSIKLQPAITISGRKWQNR